MHGDQDRPLISSEAPGLSNKAVIPGPRSEAHEPGDRPQASCQCSQQLGEPSSMPDPTSQAAAAGLDCEGLAHNGTSLSSLPFSFIVCDSAQRLAELLPTIPQSRSPPVTHLYIGHTAGRVSVSLPLASHFRTLSLSRDATLSNAAVCMQSYINSPLQQLQSRQPAKHEAADALVKSMRRSLTVRLLAPKQV